jgi:hypothetical protein
MLQHSGTGARITAAAQRARDNVRRELEELLGHP